MKNETSNGKCYITKFLDKLKPKEQAEVDRIIGLLEKHGNRLPMPYSKYLESSIFELRIQIRDKSIRLPYFFHGKQIAILTHGFYKATQKTPRVEIEKAKKHKKDYIIRKLKGEDA